MQHFCKLTKSLEPHLARQQISYFGCTEEIKGKARSKSQSRNLLLHFHVVLVTTQQSLMSEQIFPLIAGENWCGVKAHGERCSCWYC